MFTVVLYAIERVHRIIRKLHGPQKTHEKAISLKQEKTIVDYAGAKCNQTGCLWLIGPFDSSMKKKQYPNSKDEKVICLLSPL